MNQVVILAAGHGTRMKSKTPKVLQEVNGQPILRLLIKSVISSGISNKPLVVVAPDGIVIRECLGDLCRYAVQQEQLGTGHALASVREELADHNRILVLYGDHPFLKPETIKGLDNLHRRSRAVLSMMTVRVADFEDWRRVFYDFGRILRDEQDNIVKIKEKKDASMEELKIKEVNPSLFCFDGKWLWNNIEKITNQNNQGEYYLTDLVGMAMEQGQKIASLEIDSRESLGINTPEHLQIAKSLF